MLGLRFVHVVMGGEQCCGFYKPNRQNEFTVPGLIKICCFVKKRHLKTVVAVQSTVIIL